MRKRGRVDGNQKQITKELRLNGATVAILSNVGGGVPDIAVGYKGHNFLFEIKDGAQPPSKRKLTADEGAWFEMWKGNCQIITTSEQAFEIMETFLFNSRG